MRTLPLLVLLAGCHPWALNPWGFETLEDPLWDPEGAVATNDGLYIGLPHAGGLVRVLPDGTVDAVDLQDARIESLDPTPDANALVAFRTRLTCEDPDTEIEDCERTETTKELALIAEAAVQSSVAVDPHFNAVAFSPDGTRAISYLDVNRELVLEGVINLTSVAVLDLGSGDVESVQVGFAAERVLFTEDNSRAVVLSRSEVAVLDLTTSPASTDVVFPLTLDPDQTVVPVGVELTPDGRYALISVQGSADLYVLDLELHSVNIVSLVRPPAAMAVDIDLDRTILVYDQAATVDLMDHDFFDVESVSLDEPMNRIAQGDGIAVIHNIGSNYKDVYRLDLVTHELVEYRLENPAIELVVAPSEDFAVALTRAEGAGGSGVSGLYDSAPGMEVIDLRPGSDDTYPYLLEGAGVGLALSATDTSLHALVLQEGQDYLYQLDLYTGEDEEIELVAPPRAIGAMPDGTFFITQVGALGRVSFLDPATGDLSVVEGFALTDLIDPEVH